MTAEAADAAPYTASDAAADAAAEAACAAARAATAAVRAYPSPGLTQAVGYAHRSSRYAQAAVRAATEVKNVP